MIKSEYYIRIRPLNRMTRLIKHHHRLYRNFYLFIGILAIIFLSNLSNESVHKSSSIGKDFSCRPRKCEDVFYRLNTCNEFLALFIHVDKLCRTRYKLLIVQSRFRKEIFKKIECEYKTEIDFQLNVTNFPTREIWIYTRIPRNGELKFITIVFLLLLLLSLFVGIIMISFAGQVLSDTIGNLKKDKQSVCD